MTMRKFHIIGGPGSGKTCVAAQLSQRYGISTYDLDDIFWDNRDSHYNVRAPEEQRDAALREILSKESWIIEGPYYRWLRESFKSADIVILLTVSVWRRDWRILRRFAKRKLRLSPSKKKETFLGQFELLKWNHGYDGDNLLRARAFLAELGVKAVECRTLEDVFRAMQNSVRV